MCVVRPHGTCDWVWYLCSLHYAKVDDTFKYNIFRHLGRGTQQVKVVKDTYRRVPVHSADYHLLGFKWRGNTYIDCALSFGLCSAPKIFNAIADLIAYLPRSQISVALFTAPWFSQLPARERIFNDSWAVTCQAWNPDRSAEGPATTLTWFQLQWPADGHAFHITAKEMKSVLATILWGPPWTRQRISFRSDYTAVYSYVSVGFPDSQ